MRVALALLMFGIVMFVEAFTDSGDSTPGWWVQHLGRTGSMAAMLVLGLVAGACGLVMIFRMVRVNWERAKRR